MSIIFTTFLISFIFSYPEYKISEILIENTRSDYDNINTNKGVKIYKNNKIKKDSKIINKDSKGISKENQILYINDTVMSKESSINIKNKRLMIYIFMATAVCIFIILNSELENYKIISAILLLPFLIIISAVDIKTMYVYDIVCILGIIVQLITALNFFGIYGIENLIKGISVCFICSIMIAYITEAMGYGDVFMYCMCGSAISCTEPFYIIPSSFIIAFLYCILMYIIGISKKRVAFAPFIALAAFANIIGFDIIKIYMEVIRNIV